MFYREVSTTGMKHCARSFEQAVRAAAGDGDTVYIYETVGKDASMVAVVRGDVVTIVGRVELPVRLFKH